MKKALLGLGFLFLVPALMAAQPTSLSLMYQGNTPVLHHIKTYVEIQQKLPGLNLLTGFEQTLDMETVILEGVGTEDLKPPLSLELTIRRLQVRVRGNGETALFDSYADHSSPHMAQLSRIVDRPIRLHLDENYQVDGPIEDMLELSKDFPLLTLLFSERFFTDTLSSLFALAGKELSTRQRIPLSLSLGEVAPTVVPATYEVSVANFKEVEAQIQGGIEEVEVIVDPSLTGLEFLSESGEEGYGAHYTLSGHVSGKARWDRRHGMIHSLRLKHVYDALFKMGQLSWPMVLRIDHEVESQRSVPLKTYVDDHAKRHQ